MKNHFNIAKNIVHGQEVDRMEIRRNDGRALDLVIDKNESHKVQSVP